MINYPCIEQFTQFVHLKDLRPATRTEYVRYIRRLGDHFHSDPATLSEAKVRDHLLHLRQVKSYAPASLHLVRFAYRSFFVECIKTGVSWSVFSDFKIRRPRPIPTILARCEVSQLLGAVRSLRLRTCLRRNPQAQHEEQRAYFDFHSPIPSSRR